jgi:hypothetical protein
MKFSLTSTISALDVAHDAVAVLDAIKVIQQRP